MKCTRAGSSGPGFFTDFAGAKITSDAGFLLMREIDQRFGIIENGCHRFRANKTRLKMGFLAYNLRHLIRRFYLWGEDTHQSIEWIITRLVKAGPQFNLRENEKWQKNPKERGNQ